MSSQPFQENQIRYIHNPFYPHGYDEYNEPIGTPLGGFTVAWALNGTGGVSVALAFCRSDEVYSRKVGKDIAYQRLQNNECFTAIAKDVAPDVFYGDTDLSLCRTSFLNEAIRSMVLRNFWDLRVKMNSDSQENRKQLRIIADLLESVTDSGEADSQEAA